MIGSIIWLVILVIIVVRISDRKKGIRRTSLATRQRQQSGAQQQSEHRQTDRQWESGGHVSQEELKRRLQEKYRTKPKASGSVKPNMNTISGEGNSDSGASASKGNIRTGKTENHSTASRGNIRTEKAETYHDTSQGSTGYQKSDILIRASQNVEETEADMIQMPEDNDLMKMVNDIMAKGVDTSIPFERDFIAEGMDIVNRITL